MSEARRNIPGQLAQSTVLNLTDLGEPRFFCGGYCPGGDASESFLEDFLRFGYWEHWYDENDPQWKSVAAEIFKMRPGDWIFLKQRRGQNDLNIPAVGIVIGQDPLRPQNRVFVRWLYQRELHIVPCGNFRGTLHQAKNMDWVHSAMF